jgi:hypothetical protein
MSQSACFLCGSQANLNDELDPEGLTVVTCPNCGWYRLTPMNWTADERVSLAAYVRHENRVGRRSPTITEGNHRLLIRLGKDLRAKRAATGLGC